MSKNTQTNDGAEQRQTQSDSNVAITFHGDHIITFNLIYISIGKRTIHMELDCILNFGPFVYLRALIRHKIRQVAISIIIVAFASSKIRIKTNENHSLKANLKLETQSAVGDDLIKLTIQ